MPFLLALLAVAASAATAAADLESKIERAAARGLPAVVVVRVAGTLESPEAEPAGTGVIIDKCGLILTNHHVVQHARSIVVILPDDGSEHRAEVLGEDEVIDLALLRIDAGRDLPFLSIGDSDKLRPGQWVLAIGSPLGLTSTVSAGIVSYIGRDTPENSIPFIQFDAIIDKGSSGGPVLNLDAEVVGIVKSGADRGIGLAIPSNMARAFVDDVQNYGTSLKSWLGVNMQPFSGKLAEHVGLPGVAGVVISDVAPGSPAEKAGILPGDILAELGGIGLDSDGGKMGAVIRKIHESPEGVPLEAIVYRRQDGSYGRIDLEVTLVKRPRAPAAEMESDLGFIARDVTQADYRELYLDAPKGVVVSFVRPGTPAERAKLAIDDVIVAVEGRPIESVEALRASLDASKEKGAVLLEVLRARQTQLILIETPEACHQSK